MSYSRLLVRPLSVKDAEIRIDFFHLPAAALHEQPQADLEKYGRNVPGVYCFFDEKTMYIGESMHPFMRLGQHMRRTAGKEPKLTLDKDVLIYTSPQFSKSSIFHIEGDLIQMTDAYINYVDSSARVLLNANRNEPLRLEGNRYFLKDQYDGLADRIWHDWLHSVGLVKAEADVIKKTPRFILSPFKNLNSGQSEVMTELLDNWSSHGLIVVRGFPGTGKSVLAATLFHRLLEQERVCLTSGTDPSLKDFADMFKQELRGTASKVLRRLDLIKKCGADDFDLVIVDEGHRLLKKSGKGHPGKFMHLSDDENELGLLVKKFKHVVLFYDENQNVHGADFDAPDVLRRFNPRELELNAQERLSAEAGDYVRRLFVFLDGAAAEGFYDCRYFVWQFESFGEMYEGINKRLQSEKGRHGALLSGYTREWKTQSVKPDVARSQKLFDFELDGIPLRWNTYMKGWFSKAETRRLEEVGYYRVVQGMETDYTGVIIGKDLRWDEEKGCLFADERLVMNPNERPKRKSLSGSKQDEEAYQAELLRYVTNRYKVLLTRAVCGQFIYVEDEALRRKFRELFATGNQ